MNKAFKLLKNIVKYIFITLLWCTMFIYFIFYGNIINKIVGNICYTGTWERTYTITPQERVNQYFDLQKKDLEFNKKKGMKIHLLLISCKNMAIVSLKTSLINEPKLLLNNDKINVNIETKEWTVLKEQMGRALEVVSGGLGYHNIISGDVLAIKPSKENTIMNGRFKKISRKAVFDKP